MAHDSSEHHAHYILSDKTAIKVFLALVVGTILTVAVAQLNLGILNFPVAMAVATIKAYLVVSYFMGLKFDVVENRIYFLGSLVFVLIFIVLTASDLLFRENNINVPNFIRPLKSDEAGNLHNAPEKHE